MNAALHFASLLPHAVRARLAGGARRDVDRALRRAFAGDLAALLNRMRKEELVHLAGALGGRERRGRVAARSPLARGRRARGGRRGGARPPVAAGPRGARRPPGGARPGARAGAARRSLCRGRCRHPRRAAGCPIDEPDTLEDLLARATELAGSGWAPAAATRGNTAPGSPSLLGLSERGAAEPDWRGEVEVKTVPVVRDPGGLWRVAEDPAVSMADVAPERKLGTRPVDRAGRRRRRLADPVLVLPGVGPGGRLARAALPAHPAERAGRGAHPRLVPAQAVLRRLRVPR